MLYEVVYRKTKRKKYEEYAFLGVYTNKKKAMKAIKKIKGKKLFKNRKNRFYINKVRMDEKNLPWYGGFFSWY